MVSIASLDVLELEIVLVLELVAELCVLLTATLATEEVCGLVLVLLLVVKPLPSAPEPPPPPHALKNEIIVAAKRVLILGKLKLLMRYYLSHATSIDEISLRELASIYSICSTAEAILLGFLGQNSYLSTCCSKVVMSGSAMLRRL